MVRLPTLKPVRLWLRIVGALSRADRIRMAVAVALMLIGSASASFVPVVIGRAINHTVRHSAITMTGLAAPLALIGALVVIQQGVQVARRQLVENVSTGFERDTRLRVYTHLLRLDLRARRGSHIGAMYGRANRSIEGAVRLVKLGGMDFLPAVLLAAFALAVALSRNVAIGAAMFGVVPVGFVLVVWQVRNQAGVRVVVRDHKDSVDGQVVELLPALEAVRASGSEPYFVGRIREACNGLRATELAHHRAMSWFDAAKSLNEAVFLLVVLVVAIHGAGQVAAGAGEAMTYFLLYTSVLAPLRELHRILDEGAESARQAQDLFELLDEPEDVTFRQNARVTKPQQLAPVVAAHDLSFNHGARRILDGLYLSVSSGERVALVGASGCGKTTLLRLIGGLEHGYSGSLTLRGAEVAQLSRHELVDAIGYVAQEPRIFRMSVVDNILLGRPGLTRADAEEAAKQAQIHEAIVAMPNGYDTEIGERGDTLSGGQRQRICIARSLVTRPRLLLLDEPTSALDAESERGVQNAIDALDGVTMLVVAHRLSTLRNTNRILVLEDGAVVEEGSFQELALANGTFAAMLAAQGASHESFERPLVSVTTPNQED